MHNVDWELKNEGNSNNTSFILIYNKTHDKLNSPLNLIDTLYTMLNNENTKFQ